MNRQIWRHRRRVCRRRAQTASKSALERGTLPKSTSRSTTMNWQKLCNNGLPAQALFDFYYEIYALSDSERERELERANHWSGTWLSLRIDMVPWRVTVPRLKRAITRLRNGRGSPDGCSAEMFKHLPDPALEQLALFFTSAFAHLVFPETWTVVLANLIPKIVGANDLGKFRAISCLPVARKLYRSL